MAKQAVRPAAVGRGRAVKLAPRVPEPREWLVERFDWESTVTVVDMFSGAGGMSLGFDSVPGMAVVGAFEQDGRAAETHAANIAGAVFTGDVNTIASFEAILRETGIRRVDILIGGPPCQGFSKLGKGALRKLALGDNRGVDLGDPRNWLFRQFTRAAAELRPQIVVMENVQEMARYEPVMTEIGEVFEELGYRHDSRVLKADEYGVPQRRKRLFIVGSRHDLPVAWPVPVSARFTLRDAISDLPAISHSHFDEAVAMPSDEESPNPYARSMRAGLDARERHIVRDHITRVHRPEDVEVFRNMREGARYTDVPEEFRRYRADIFIDKYHRMIWDEPAWTVTAHLAKDGYKYIHPGQPRTISVREAARIQSFPDTFRFAGFRTNRFWQVGNAVPPRLAEALAQSLLPLVI